MRFKSLIVTFYLLFFTYYLLSAQGTHELLLNKKLQKDIIENTREFDSLVCIDISGYWRDEGLLRGIGYKQGDVYRVVISFVDSGNNHQVDRIIKRRIKDASKSDSVKTMNYQQLFTASNDSLELKSRKPGEEYIIDDASYWTIAGIYPAKNRFIIKQVYALSFYQYTSEQKLMKGIITELNSLIGKE
jgi:hypothetical protein